MFFGIVLGELLIRRRKTRILLLEFGDSGFRSLRPLAVVLVVLDRRLKLRLEFGKRGLRFIGYEENILLRAAVVAFRLDGFALNRGRGSGERREREGKGESFPRLFPTGLWEIPFLKGVSPAPRLSSSCAGLLPG